MLATLSRPDLLRRLTNPHSHAAQQPSAKFVNGNYRALDPDYSIAVALWPFGIGWFVLVPAWYAYRIVRGITAFGMRRMTGVPVNADPRAGHG